MNAIEQMQKALKDADPDDDEAVVEVAQYSLAEMLQELLRLRAKVTELQAAGSRLVADRQAMVSERRKLAW